MTVVAAVYLLQEIVMIADTRIWWDVNRPPEDKLIKLYRLQGFGKPAVVGFAGRVDSAADVLKSVKAKCEAYRGRPALSSLKEHLRKWIEEVTVGLDRDQRRLKFVLCGLEPKGHLAVVHNGKKVRSLPLPETHVYEFTVVKRTGEVTVERIQRVVEVIGSGRCHSRQIASKVSSLMKWGIRHSQRRPARAVVLGEALASVFYDARDDKVGGPFQVLRIAPEDVYSYWVWPPGTKSRDVVVREEPDRLVLSNRDSEQDYVLYPIWQLRGTEARMAEARA